jgi:phenylalanyl-tRNA synthetase beta chain
MKFSEQWLYEWVQPDVERDELLEQLTMAGLEVDGVEPLAGDFSGVVVGRIESIAAHPNAEKLRVCQVNDGTETVQVVCGAPNARAGLVTAFARIGAVLPGNFKIKQAKLRQEVSLGMLCSAAELELGEDADGIIELSESLVPGADLMDALNLHDVCVDLDLTPNRGDCLSIRGIAREVGVLSNAPVTEPQIGPVPQTHEDTFAVSLEAPASCPRYLGRIVRGVDPGTASPEWLQEKLRRCGLRSIDAVVDITNYVMLELGQPMHAFDLAQLSGSIAVRMPTAGESLTLLDGKTVELDAETLLIADDKGPVAMAGVMGGERSGINEQTKDVFLECAFFAPLAVAGTARRYGMHTDASHRYERGVDFELQHLAMERATALLVEVVGGEPGPVTEALSAEHLPKTNSVSISQARLDALLGAPMDPVEVDRVFAQLDFEVANRSDGADGVAWTVQAPSHRFDIAIEADLVEEVCRIYGYNRIPSSRPTTDLTLRPVELEVSDEQQLKVRVAAMGFQEAITYSFVDPVLLDILDPTAEPLALANPMSSEQSVMRTTLLPGLLDVLRNNLARQQDRVRVFELGQCFRPAAKGGASEPLGLVQVDLLGGLIAGPQAIESWHGKPQMVDFYDLKGAVEQLLQWRGGDAAEIRFTKREDPTLHPGQAADVWIGAAWAGRLGQIHPEVQARLNLSLPAFVFELSAEQLLARPLRRFAAVSKFPAVRRDLALLVDREVSAADLERCVRNAVGEVLVDFRLFDVYQGEGIDSAKKSVALGLTLQRPSATLTDIEIGSFVDGALSALVDEFHAQQR